ncbi:hypothetical protein [Actinophytocola sp. KF-1]
MPILTIAVLFFMSDIAFLGVVLIILAALIVVVDSWANRPIRDSSPSRGRDDY